MSSLVFYIEGNIGAGKSTVVKRLQDVYGSDKCLALTEPVSDWPSLRLFYSDKQKYAYQLQSEINLSLHNRETQCEPRGMYIMERSLYSSVEIFAKLNCTPFDMEFLRASCANLGRNSAKKYHIYLKTPVDMCYDNVRKRNKPTDAYITREYLEILECRHMELFGCDGTPTVNGAQAIDDVVADLYWVIERLRSIE